MADSKKATLRRLLVILIALIVLGVAGKKLYRWYVKPTIDPNIYQAVFLEGNQHYIGHLKNLGARYPYLEDVYYVRIDSNASTSPTEEDTRSTLIKLGNEIHGPEDTMYLNWNRVLFWENLKPDSQVVQGILKEKMQRITGAPAAPVAPALQSAP